jgi:hypothetical protein
MRRPRSRSELARQNPKPPQNEPNSPARTTRQFGCKRRAGRGGISFRVRSRCSPVGAVQFESALGRNRLVDEVDEVDQVVGLGQRGLGPGGMALMALMA